MLVLVKYLLKNCNNANKDYTSDYMLEIRSYVQASKTLVAETYHTIVFSRTLPAVVKGVTYNLTLHYTLNL